jgi:A/G-specific adenine glycosylase
VTSLRSQLLAWFDRHQRGLPWRRTKDPYAIWVSEVMLQQTQVDRVVPFFERFLATFPTVTALAAASVPEVLAQWSGLGYYSRARNLHKAAQAVVATHQGTLPDTVESLLTLPGFGRYTAGAVASIAFGKAAPLVDGNVARVLSRLFVIEGVPGEKQREAALWAKATELVAGERPGDWNQALMELGATVCVPSNPLCLVCPIQRSCGALAKGRVDELPPPKPAAKRKRLELVAAIVDRSGDLLLARRPESGLFGGLWELPCAEPFGKEPGDFTLERLLGKRAAIGPELVVVQRTLTHRDLVLRLHPVALSGRLPKPPASYEEWRFYPREEIAGLGMASAMRSAMEEAVPPRPSRRTKAT